MFLAFYAKHVCFKVECDLEKGEERAETGEMKILELEEELRLGVLINDTVNHCYLYRVRKITWHTCSNHNF